MTKTTFFQFKIQNNSSAASITDVELTATGNAVFDRFESGSSYSVTPDPLGNYDGVNYQTVSLNFFRWRSCTWKL